MILTTITNFITHIISTAGYSGVTLLMAIESAAIPIPSEIIMPFAGNLAAMGRFSLPLLAIAGGAGSAIGSAVTYWIGRYGGRPLIERYGKYVFISQHDLDIADRFFARFGHWSTFLGRLLPVVRTFISLSAGIAREGFGLFLLYSFLGSFIWSYALAYAGFKLGPEWTKLHDQLHWLDYVVIGLIIIGAALWVYRHVRQNKVQH